MKFDVLHIAEYGTPEEMREAINKNVDINMKDDEGITPLMGAIAYDHLEIAKLLLENGASVDIQDDNGFTPLHYAYEYIMPDIAKAMVEKNPKILNKENKYGNQPLWTAVTQAQIPLEHLEFLLKKGADINHKNKTNSSPYDLVKEYNVDELTELFARY